LTEAPLFLRVGRFPNRERSVFFRRILKSAGQDVNNPFYFPPKKEVRFYFSIRFYSELSITIIYIMLICQKKIQLILGNVKERERLQQNIEKEILTLKTRDDFEEAIKCFIQNNL
jgi:hypothetical protein